MNTLLLLPNDTLFFRDGRPMSGSLSGHGAAWPLPSVTNAALHAALHRAKMEGVHGHDQIRLKSGNREAIRKDDRKFGSLLTAGPFPVSPDGTWFFPRALDAGTKGSNKITLQPLSPFEKSKSSLPAPLHFPVGNIGKPSKQIPHAWWSQDAWEAYLSGTELLRTAANDNPDPHFNDDEHFSDAEHNIGIGIDDETDTQDGDRFFSSHSLRLREQWKLGLLASAHDKINGNREDTRDLIEHLFDNEQHVIIGGQQRACSVIRKAAPLCLPIGKSKDFEHGGKFLVKWILLSPAVFPEIREGSSRDGTPIPYHPGGWLPNWINLHGKVQLLDGPGKNYARRHHLPEGKRIDAALVAAITGKPVPVTGYALDSGLEDRKPGPKPTHLAVPAGSVYYFECADEAEACKLAAALNWHGETPEISNLKSQIIKNRRSTLMGEKGFGLGVCSTFHHHRTA